MTSSVLEIRLWVAVCSVCNWASSPVESESEADTSAEEHDQVAGHG